MEDFFENWKKDKKFRTKVKLIAYTSFVIIVSIYAFSINKTPTNSFLNEALKNTSNNKQESTNILNIPDTYEYTITINIDDKEYTYIGRKTQEREEIQKNIDNKITDYVYQNNQYYIADMVTIDNYIVTTRDEVYDVINYNYINLDTINEYLKKANKESNQYLVYLKDVILGNDSDNYFVIDINNNKINIDYTALMKEFNKDLNKYMVNIEIKEISNN